MSLVLLSSMMVSMDVTLLLEGIDACTSAPVRACRGLVLSLFALPPHLVIDLVTPYPSAYANTTCCQMLAINGFLCRPLNHLSAPSHHMLGYGDLDLLLWISSFFS
jgi:hypothetical protein